MLYQGLKFDETCPACPEQYDVWCNEEQVGYVRLGWGYLYCEYPDVGGEVVYEHSFNDEFKGRMDDAEREYHLNLIATALNRHLEQD